MPEARSAVLLDLECNPIGYISLKVALSMVKKRGFIKRWVTYLDNYRGVFPENKGRVFWFDLLEPLNVPERYLLKMSIIVK